MTPVDPRLNPQKLPDGSKAVVLAEKQKEYEPLPCIRTREGAIVTRWRPSEEDLRRLVRGEDVYLVVVVGGALVPAPPVALSVGPDHAVACVRGLAGL